MTSLPMASREEIVKAAMKNHLNERSYSPVHMPILSIRCSLDVAIPRCIEWRHYNMSKMV